MNSAYRHGIAERDILHAWKHVIRVVSYEYNGAEQLLYIGPSTSGALLEIVALPIDTPTRIIHADILRPSRYHYLR